MEGWELEGFGVVVGERGWVGLENSIIRETYYAIYYLNVFQNRKHGD